MLEPLDGTRRRGRPECRTEALIGALMRVEASQEFAIGKAAGLRGGAAVVRQRRIDREPTRGRLDDQAIEPFRRNEVEQRRGCNEIDRAVEREFEVADEIDRLGNDGEARRLPQRRGLGEETQIIVDQPPGLARGKVGPDRPQRRTGAAREVDDRNRSLLDESIGDRIEHGRVARGEIIGLAQGKPLGRKAAHARPSSARANSAPCSRQDGNTIARAPAARRWRSSGLSISRRSTAANASTSSGGTSTPAPAGTVSGIAPAVVPTTG